MRLTNKKIIQELLPILQDCIKREKDIQYDRTDYYGHPHHVEYKGDIQCSWTKYGNDVIITVFKPLKGKYDGATLHYRVGDNGYGYSKEYTGMGNGFYADVSFDGKIIRSEWD